MKNDTGNKDAILQALVRISDISNTSDMELEKKLELMLDIVLKCLNSQKGSIMILKGRKTLRVVASSNQELKGVMQNLKENAPSAWVVKHKKPLFNDGSHADDLHLMPDRYHKTAFMIAPIISGDKVYGVLSITEKIGADRFSDAERDIFLNLTGQIISALELFRLSECLKSSRMALREKHRRLKKLERFRTDMFNMLIHDLKGPLSVIVANLDILSYTSDTDNMQYVNTARSGCDAMYRMISNLLDVARLEDGSLKLILEKLQPALLIEEAIARIQGSAEVREVTISNTSPSPSNGRCLFRGDQMLLLRVLQNLFMNAVRFSPRGGSVETGFCIDDSEFIEFFVKDNGPGIPTGSHKSVFDKYVQIFNSKDSRNDYSAGLGLTFCKMAVEAHQGKIWVESDGTSGSCFKFRLPL